MDILARVEQYEGRKYWVMRKKSWGKDYISVDHGSTWIQTCARRVAFAETDPSKWAIASEAI